MLTTDALRALGADVDDGIRRCVNNETFYLKMVDKALSELRTEELKAALNAGDLDRAFEAAHGIKGVLANLALTPALIPVAEMTELLRARTAADYTPYLKRMEEQLTLLQALREN